MKILIYGLPFCVIMLHELLLKIVVFWTILYIKFGQFIHI